MTLGKDSKIESRWPGCRMYEVRRVPPPTCGHLQSSVLQSVRTSERVYTCPPSLSPEILSRHKQHAGYRHCQGTVVTKQQTKTKYVECALSSCGEREILMPAAETTTSLNLLWLYRVIFGTNSSGAHSQIRGWRVLDCLKHDLSWHGRHVMSYRAAPSHDMWDKHFTCHFYMGAGEAFWTKC